MNKYFFVKGDMLINHSISYLNHSKHLTGTEVNFAYVPFKTLFDQMFHGKEIHL